MMSQIYAVYAFFSVALFSGTSFSIILVRIVLNGSSLSLSSESSCHVFTVFSTMAFSPKQRIFSAKYRLLIFSKVSDANGLV